MSRADELADRLFQQACDSSTVSGEVVAELRRLSAVNAELLEALKAMDDAFWGTAEQPEQPAAIAQARAAIQKAEEA